MGGRGRKIRSSNHPPLHSKFKEASLDYKRHLVLVLDVIAYAFNPSAQEAEEC